MKLKTVIYVTKDGAPGAEQCAEGAYDKQFNRKEGTVENEAEWNAFWTDVQTAMTRDVETSPYFLAFVFNEAGDVVISFSPEDLSDDPDDMGYGSSYGKDWHDICLRQPEQTKESWEDQQKLMQEVWEDFQRAEAAGEDLSRCEPYELEDED